MKPLICFDMDNTLLKSDLVHIDAFNLAFKKQNLKKPPSQKLKKMLDGRQASVIVKTLYPKLKEKIINKIVKDHDKFVINHSYKKAIQIPGANTALNKIKKNFTLAIITNCKKKEIRPILNGANINPRIFNKKIGADQVKHSKPFPDLIFKAAELTHHKAACIVGDSTYDIKAGKNAKIKTIALTTGHHSKKEHLKNKPTMIVKDITKVPTALSKIFLIKKKMIKR